MNSIYSGVCTVLGRHFNNLKKSMTGDYDSHYSIDYLLKDKINTKFAFQPNIWQIYDQLPSTRVLNSRNFDIPSIYRWHCVAHAWSDSFTNCSQ
jgi:hypothetical protein